MAGDVAFRTGNINTGCIAPVCQSPLPQFTMGHSFAVMASSLLLLAFAAAVAFDPGLSVANASNGSSSLWDMVAPSDPRINCYERSRPVNEYSCHNAWRKIEVSVKLFRAADRALPESQATLLPYRWLSGKLRSQNHDRHGKQPPVSFSYRELDGLSYSSEQKRIGSR